MFFPSEWDKFLGQDVPVEVNEAIVDGCLIGELDAMICRAAFFHFRKGRPLTQNEINEAKSAFDKAKILLPEMSTPARAHFQELLGLAAPIIRGCSICSSEV